MGDETRHNIVYLVCDDEFLMLILSLNKHIDIGENKNIRYCDMFLNTEDKLCPDQNSNKHIKTMIIKSASSNSKAMQILTLFITAFQTINYVSIELFQARRLTFNFRNRICNIIILLLKKNHDFHDKKFCDSS